MDSMKDDLTGEELTGEDAKDRACLEGQGKKKVNSSPRQYALGSHEG